MAQDYDNMEYQLNDDNVVYDHDDSGDEHASSEEHAIPVVEKPKKRSRFMYFAILVLIGLVGYKMYGLIKGSDVIFKKSSKSAVMKPVEKPVAEPDKNAATMLDALKKDVTSQQTAQAEQEAAAMKEQQAEESNMTEMSQQDTVRINTVESSVSQLKNSVDGLQAVVSSLANQVKETRVMTQQLTQKKEMTEEAKARVIRANKRFYVNAVIPGRAWLVGADGTEMTVTIGNSVPGYGNVTSIDAYSGMVHTTSGVSIYYGMGNR